MPTFVLIHGAWHTGTTWDRVVPLMAAAGCIVYCPTLDSQSRETRLSTHISEACALIESEGLQNIILVGHSYGGMVITGVADRLKHRIAGLIYLDAFVPRNGQSLLDVINGEQAEAYLEGMREGFGYFVPMPYTLNVLGITKKEDEVWIRKMLVNQPINTLAEPLYYKEEVLVNIPKAYVYCTKSGFDATVTKVLQSAFIRGRDEKWQCFELQAGHDCMVTNPEEVVDIFKKVATHIQATNHPQSFGKQNA